MNKTNNDIMFLCQLDLVNGRPNHEIDVFSFINDYKQTNGLELNNNFSFDNWSMIACWIKKFDPEYLSDVPLFGRHTWRFWDNGVFFLYVRFPKIGFFFLPLLFLSMYISMKRVWRTNKRGHRYIDTDGKLINFYRCYSFGFNKMWKTLDNILEKDPDMKSFINISELYLTNEATNIKLEVLNALRVRYEMILNKMFNEKV